VVADIGEQLALRVLCAAYWQGLYGADFVWILPGFQTASNGSVRRQWWRQAERLTNCSQTEFTSTLVGHFALDQALRRPFEDGLTLVGGRVSFRRNKDGKLINFTPWCQIRR